MEFSTFSKYMADWKLLKLLKRNRRLRGRRRIEQFVTTESLEYRMLLTGSLPVISSLQLMNDTGIVDDRITTDPRVQGILNDSDFSSYDYRVEIDLNSDQIFDRTIYVTPGSTFQFDPSLDLPYGNVTLAFRGVEYSYDLMEDIYGPAQTLSFTYQNPNDLTNQAPTVLLANLTAGPIPENQDFTNRFKIADIPRLFGTTVLRLYDSGVVSVFCPNF